MAPFFLFLKMCNLKQKILDIKILNVRFFSSANVTCKASQGMGWYFNVSRVVGVIATHLCARTGF